MCRGCTGINIGEVFFQIVGEQGHTFGYLGRFDSGILFIFFIFVQHRVVPPKYLFFVYILIRREGVIWI